MSWATSDLAQVLIAPQREFAGFAQGIIRAWDPTTFANTISVRGTDLHNLPVASGVEALTYQVGDVVVLSRWQPTGGGLATYWVGSSGRVIEPGTGAAEKAIAFMRTSLGSAVAKSVMAEAVKSASQSGQTLTDSIAFGDGSSGGPVIPDVRVTSAGKMIVYMGARVDALSDSDASFVGGLMSVQISGASSVSPSINTAVDLSQGVTVTGASWTHRAQGRVMVGHEFTGLSEGAHTVAAKYASRVEGQSVSFDLRTLIVQAF